MLNFGRFPVYLFRALTSKRESVRTDIMGKTTWIGISGIEGVEGFMVGDGKGLMCVAVGATLGLGEIGEVGAEVGLGVLVGGGKELVFALIL